jgi:hypothetical protein
MNDWAGRFPQGIGDGNLHINVCAPTRDLARLTLHTFKVVSKNLNRDREMRKEAKYFLAEFLVIRNPSLSHQSWICGKSLDQGTLGPLQNAIQICCINKKLYSELVD